MATRRFEINKEQSLAQISAGNAGNGNDTHCPNGKSSFDTSITFRTLLRFAQDYSGMAKVTKVELFVRKTSGVHTAQGSGAHATVQRCGDSGSWSSGGGSENSWSTSASGERFPGPATGFTSAGSMTGTGWQSLDITDSYQAYIPSYVLNPDGNPGAGETNNGIRVKATDEGTVSDSFEFYGAASSYPPYLLVTYTTNTAPNTPVNTSPAAGATLPAGTSPTFSWTGSDPDSGDTRSASTLQVSTDPAFGTTLYSGAAGSGTGFSQTGVAYPGPALPAGVPLYWRVRNTDQDAANSSYSTATQFTIAAVPTISATTPGPSTLADVHNLADLAIWAVGGLHAKPIVKWTYVHAGSRGMAAYRVRMYSDALSVLYDSGTVAATATPGQVVTVNIPTAIVLGTQYRWGVEVQDVDGNWSAVMTPTPFKVRWGQAVYSHNVGTGATGFKWSNSSPANGRAQFLYRSADDAAGTGASAWTTALPTPGKAYVQVLVRLLATVAGSNPALPDMTLTYTPSGTATSPDRWNNASLASCVMSLDSSVKRFGAYSLKVRSTTTGSHYIHPFTKVVGDGIPVVPGTDYTYSAYVRTNGPLAGGAVAKIGIRNKERTAYIVALTPTDAEAAIQTSDSSGHPEGWQRLAGWFTVPEGVNLVTPDIWSGGGAIGNEYWVDGVKLEEGRVASTWTPGFLGEAATADRMGLMVDAASGGIFRLRGSIGGTRDVVELGPHGMLYAGDVELSSPFEDVLMLGDGSAGNPTELVVGYPKSLGGQIRTISGVTGYGFIVRQDASRVYFLLTNVGDPFGSYNALRPFFIDNATGKVTMNNGLDVVGGLTSGGVAVATAAQLPIIKTVRTAALGALAGGANADRTITWPSPFADTNYTVVVTAHTEGDPAGRLISLAITSKTAAAVVIRVMNNTASTSINPAFHAIGIHD
jgi:hypothetical protein